MTGWNMPPGCNVSDIPGNRPEDEAFENFALGIEDKAAEFNVAVPDEKLIDWLWKQTAVAYAKGYADGRDEESQYGETLMAKFRQRLRDLAEEF